jgi:hypothetical protein
MTERLSRRVVHHVRVMHGGTGKPLERIRARLVDPAWSHWAVRQRGADVVLSTEERLEPRMPATTDLEIELADESRRGIFENSGTETVTLNRGADEEVTLTLDPRPVSLEVSLSKNDGSASTGRTVEARSGGVTVSLPEVGGTRIYRSAPTRWDPAKQPFGIYVDGQKQSSVSLEYSSPVTRVKVIDP